MSVSGADLYVGEICGLAFRLLYHGRRIPAEAGPVAELAISVLSPGVGVPVAAHGQGIPVSGADLYGLQSFARVSGVGGVAHAHRNSRLHIGTAGVVAELAIAVGSPGVCVSVAAYGQRISVSGADLYVGEIRRRVCRLLHHGRRKTGSVRLVAELSTVVASPGVCVPVAAQGQ